MRNIAILFFLMLTINGYTQECVERVVSSRTAVTIFTTDRLFSWGPNSNGELGIGTTDIELTAVPTVMGDSWRDISHSEKHTLALNFDGTLWAWGNNDFGQLGDGTTTSSLVPVQIGTDTNWTAISAGNLHSLALKSDGTLWGWGGNQAKQLMNSETPTFSTPNLLDEATDWDQIEASFYRNFVVKTDGTLWGRGRNMKGVLGILPTSAHFVNELTRIGTDSNWVSVKTGYEHVLAMKSDSTLWAWGSGYGIGYGSENSTHEPTQVGSGKWKDFAAGRDNSIAIKPDGSLWEWGGGFYLATGLYPVRLTPVQVEDDTDWEKVGMSYFHFMAIKEDKSLWTWGYNGGLYGNGTESQVDSPILTIPCGSAVNTHDYERVHTTFYPNPVADVMQWSSETKFSTYHIVNILGQTIMSGSVDADQLYLSELKSGMYIIHFVTETGRTVKHKFLKS